MEFPLLNSCCGVWSFCCGICVVESLMWNMCFGIFVVESSLNRRFGVFVVFCRGIVVVAS